LNLNISASRQNIKNLDSNFEAIHVRIIPANFQASSFTGVGGEWGDRRTDMWRQAFLHRSLYKIFINLPLHLALGGIIKSRSANRVFRVTGHTIWLAKKLPTPLKIFCLEPFYPKIGSPLSDNQKIFETKFVCISSNNKVWFSFWYLGRDYIELWRFVKAWCAEIQRNIISSQHYTNMPISTLSEMALCQLAFGKKSSRFRFEMIFLLCDAFN